VTIAHVSPPVSDAMPKAMNVYLTFAEALKLHLFPARVTLSTISFSGCPEGTLFDDQSASLRDSR